MQNFSIGLNTLNGQLLSSIYEFISLRDLFQAVALINKSSYNFVCNDKNFLKRLVQLLLDTLPQLLNLNDSSITDILTLLKTITSYNPESELPFLGVKSDTNAQQNLPYYWIDKIFTKLNGNERCCSGMFNNSVTAVSTNLNVLGSLSKFMVKLTDLNTSVKQKLVLEENVETTRIEEIPQVAELIVEYGPTFYCPATIPNTDAYKKQVTELATTLIEKYQTLQELLSTKLSPQIIDLSDEKDQVSDHIAVITGLSIFRPRFVTCPVKTVAIFVSMNPISFEETIVKMFDNLNTPEKISELYTEFLGNLPKIFETNVYSLVKHSSWKSPYNGVRSITFKNQENKISSSVRPVCWLQFEGPHNDLAAIADKYLYEMNEYKDLLNVKFSSNNYFAGSHVLMKMIDCYKTSKHSQWAIGCNMDVAFCTFTGSLIEVGAKCKKEKMILE
jgi:hypothetical protein